MSNMFNRCKIVICLSSVLLTHCTIDTHNSGKSAPIIVACVGDSITEGLAYPGQKFNLSESYPHLLQNHFNKSRYKVWGTGIFIYIYICIYVHMYVCIFMSMYIYIYIYMNIYI
jgi:hypothetical protein